MSGLFPLTSNSRSSFSSEAILWNLTALTWSVLHHDQHGSTRSRGADVSALSPSAPTAHAPSRMWPAPGKAPSQGSHGDRRKAQRSRLCFPSAAQTSRAGGETCSKDVTARNPKSYQLWITLRGVGQEGEGFVDGGGQMRWVPWGNRDERSDVPRALGGLGVWSPSVPPRGWGGGFWSSGTEPGRFSISSLRSQQLQCSYITWKGISKVFWIYRSGHSTETSPFDKNIHLKLFNKLFKKSFSSVQLLNSFMFTFTSPGCRKWKAWTCGFTVLCPSPA